MKWGLLALVVLALVTVSLRTYSPRRGSLKVATANTPTTVVTPALPSPSLESASPPSPEAPPTPAPDARNISLKATPTLSPSSPTPPPPLPALDLLPRQVRQGRVLVVRVPTAKGVSVQGYLDGNPLSFLPYPRGYWAIVGFAPWATTGVHKIRVVTTDASGRSITAEDSIEVVSVQFPVDMIELASEQSSLLAPARVSAEQDLIASFAGRMTPTTLWEGQFIPPAGGQVSSLFGARRSYNGGPATGYHEGLDIAADAGAPVVAANSGVVVLARALDVRGNGILIDHGVGVYSGYYHLSQIMVQEGQTVAKGQLIGMVGETGLATGPHLHWEIRVRGVNVDPLEWLERQVGP